MDIPNQGPQSRIGLFFCAGYRAGMSSGPRRSTRSESGQAQAGMLHDLSGVWNLTKMAAPPRPAIWCQGRGIDALGSARNSRPTATETPGPRTTTASRSAS